MSLNAAPATLPVPESKILTEDPKTCPKCAWERFIVRLLRSQDMKTFTCARCGHILVKREGSDRIEPMQQFTQPSTYLTREAERQSKR